MKVLLLGGGGREHALGWKLAQTASELVCAPGNPGLAAIASRQVDVDITGVQQLDLSLLGGHSEQANAPHRAGLTSTPARVETNTFHDLIDLAAAKLILNN